MSTIIKKKAALGRGSAGAAKAVRVSHWKVCGLKQPMVKLVEQPLKAISSRPGPSAEGVAISRLALGMMDAAMDNYAKGIVSETVDMSRMRGALRKLEDDVLVEKDGGSYHSHIQGVPLYGCGDTKAESIAMLRREVRSLKRDLDGMPDSPEWEAVKKKLDSMAV